MVFVFVSCGILLVSLWCFRLEQDRSARDAGHGAARLAAGQWGLCCPSCRVWWQRAESRKGIAVGCSWAWGDGHVGTVFFKTCSFEAFQTRELRCWLKLKVAKTPGTIQPFYFQWKMTWYVEILTIDRTTGAQSVSWEIIDPKKIKKMSHQRCPPSSGDSQTPRPAPQEATTVTKDHKK